MATEILQKSGTPIVWADVTDYVDNDGMGVRTHQLDLTSIASLAARQGAKADMGAVRAAAFAVTLRVEFDVAPDSGDVVSLWWAPSPSPTAAVGNPGGTSGADEAYTGTTGDSLPDSILQCKLIGNLVCTSDVAPIAESETFIYSPEHRYGFPVVYNEAAQAFEGDAIEMAVSFTPIIDEAQ